MEELGRKMDLEVLENVLWVLRINRLFFYRV